MYRVIKEALKHMPLPDALSTKLKTDTHTYTEVIFNSVIDILKDELSDPERLRSAMRMEYPTLPSSLNATHPCHGKEYRLK
jgi:hypothetical protein